MPMPFGAQLEDRSLAVGRWARWTVEIDVAPVDRFLQAGPVDVERRVRGRRVSRHSDADVFGSTGRPLAHRAGSSWHVTIECPYRAECPLEATLVHAEPLARDRLERLAQFEFEVGAPVNPICAPAHAAEHPLHSRESDRFGPSSHASGDPSHRTVHASLGLMTNPRLGEADPLRTGVRSSATPNGGPQGRSVTTVLRHQLGARSRMGLAAPSVPSGAASWWVGDVFPDALRSDHASPRIVSGAHPSELHAGQVWVCTRRRSQRSSGGRSGTPRPQQTSSDRSRRHPVGIRSSDRWPLARQLDRCGLRLARRMGVPTPVAQRSPRERRGAVRALDGGGASATTA